MQNGALLISLKFRENIVHTSHSYALTDTDYDVVSSAEIKNNMGEIRSVIKENLELSNDVTGHVDGLRQSIELLESMIVREDDLTALFQNYTLNLNINRDKNFEHTASSKRIEAQAGSNVIDM